MAKKQIPTITKLDLLEDQLTCPVCLDSFKDPRTLPCLHSFCAGCLERLPQVVIVQTGCHGLNCPTCRAKADLPDQGVKGYPKAFHLNNILEAVQTIAQQQDEPEPPLMCGNCLKNVAEVYCVECDKMICQLCNDVHQRWTAMADHKVVSIEEGLLKRSQQKQPEKPEPVISELKCPTHDKPLDLYCVTCEEPICYHCTIKGHKGHTHDLVVDTYAESKAILKERIKTLVKNIKETEKKQAAIHQSKKEIQEKGGKCKASVNELCDEFIQKIEKVRTLGLQCVDDGVSAYAQFEDGRLKIVETELSAQNGCKEVAETTVENSTPSQLLAMKKDMMAGIDRLLPTPKPRHPIVPSRSVDVPPFGDLYAKSLPIVPSRSVDVPPFGDLYAMPKKQKPSKKAPMPPERRQADLYTLPTKKPIYSGDLALPTKKSTKDDIFVEFAEFRDPSEDSYYADLYALPTKKVPKRIDTPPMPPSRSIQDQAVVDLREKIFSTVNFDYPEEALKQFKCILDIPDEILVGKVSTGTFALSYMGKPVLVGKDKISCCFESTTSTNDIACKTDYFTKDNVVKYQIVFTTPELRKDGHFRFTLKISSFVFSTNKSLKVVLEHDEHVIMPPKPSPKNTRMVMYSTIKST